MTCGLNLGEASLGPVETDLLNTLGEGGAGLTFTSALLLMLSGITGTLSAAGRGEDGVVVAVVALFLRCSAFNGYKRCTKSSAARGAL